MREATWGAKADGELSERGYSETQAKLGRASRSRRAGGRAVVGEPIALRWCEWRALGAANQHETAPSSHREKKSHLL